MAIFFGHVTAIRILNSPDAPEFEVTDETPVSSGYFDRDALRGVDLGSFGLDERNTLDIVVGSSGKRRNSRRIRCHVSEDNLPHGAYLRIAPDVYVASPALCLLQNAPRMTYADRIKLAACYCGTYAPSKTNSRGFIDRMPLAREEELLAFMAACPSMRGVRQAREAVLWAFPNSASPMETKMVMPFYLPSKRGGHGIAKPCMNYELTLSDRARAMTGRKTVKIDAYWEDFDIGFEYQSKLIHGHEERYGEDIGRQLAIESMGKTLHMVTLEQLKNIDQLDYLAELVAARADVELDLEEGKGRRMALIADVLHDGPFIR